MNAETKRRWPDDPRAVKVTEEWRFVLWRAYVMKWGSLTSGVRGVPVWKDSTTVHTVMTGGGSNGSNGALERLINGTLGQDAWAL